MTLYATLQDREFRSVRPPSDIVLEVQKISATAHGGYKDARITVTGNPDSIVSVASWLRYGVKIHNGNGAFVWGGFINEIELSIGGVTASLNMDAVFNRVRVAYTYADPNGVMQRGETEWFADSVSVATYGAKELLLSISESSAGAAESLAARRLERSGRPVGNPTIAGKETSATLYCRGWLGVADWRYYADTTARIERPDANAPQILGWELNDDWEIGFVSGGGNFLICDLGRRFNSPGIKAGDVLFVRNAPGNDGQWVVLEPTTFGGAEIVASSGITFEMNDDLLYSDLSAFQVYNMLRVSGSLHNDGVYFQDRATDRGYTHLTVSGGALPDGAFNQDEYVNGYTVTITQGNSIKLTERPLHRAAGFAGVRVTLRGVRIAQRIVLPDKWSYFGRIALKVNKVGSPPYNLNVTVYNDAGGVPGSPIAYASVDETEIGTTSTWKWFDFAFDEGGQPNTTYWFVVEKDSEFNDPLNYYVVSIDTETGGAADMLQWDGENWQAVNWHLAYRLWGEEDTGVQIRNMITRTCGDVITGVSIYNPPLVNETGIISPRYRIGDTTAATEIKKLLEMGTSAGNMLRVNVTEGRAVIIEAVPPAPPNISNYTWTPDGVLSRVSGFVDEGVLFAGEWLRIAWPGQLIDSLANVSWLFVDTIDYDAKTGKYTITESDKWRSGLGAG